MVTCRLDNRERKLLNNSTNWKDARSKPRHSFDLFIFSNHAVKYLRNAYLIKRTRKRWRNTNAKKHCKEDQVRKRKGKREKKDGKNRKRVRKAQESTNFFAVEEIGFKALLDLEASHSFKEDFEKFAVKPFDGIDMELVLAHEMATLHLTPGGLLVVEVCCEGGNVIDIKIVHLKEGTLLVMPLLGKLFTLGCCGLFILMVFYFERFIHNLGYQKIEQIPWLSIVSHNIDSIKMKLLDQDPRSEKDGVVSFLRRLPEVLETVVSQGIGIVSKCPVFAVEASSDSDSELSSNRKPRLCLPPLPSVLDKLLYDYATNNPEGSEDVLFREDTIYVEHYRFECLRPKLWLNDSIIDAFSRICSLRDRSKPVGSPKTWFLPTFLAHRWMGTCNFSSHYHGDYKDMGRIFLPCNVGGVHWVGICVDFLNKTTFLLDSIREYCPLEWVQDKVSWLQTLLNDKFPSDHQVDISEFPIVRAEWLPEQPNSYDCGVYVCVYMDFLEKVVPKPDVVITFNTGAGRTYVCSRLLSDPNNKMREEITRDLEQRLRLGMEDGYGWQVDNYIQ